MAEGGEELLDYEEVGPAGEAGGAVAAKGAKGDYVSVHTSTFKDFLLKDELLRAIADCGFEQPSQVQHECIPQAIVGGDIVCQAKAGMGKTAVFVLSTLHLLDTTSTAERKGPAVLVIAHTRELAFQINTEFERFSKYFKGFKSMVIYGGVPIEKDRENIKANKPQVVVATPGRLVQLVREKTLDVSELKHFVLDECDTLLQNNDMRSDVQEVFKATPHNKQVLMFSATLPAEVRATCKKFMKKPLEIFVDDDKKLTLHGLKQFYVKLSEAQKNRQLVDLIDNLEFNQLIVFVKSVERCDALNKILNDNGFPSIAIHGRMAQEKRIANYSLFKKFDKRILVATDIFGRGMDIVRVNIVINYDMTVDSDSYLHRVARAGRFGTKGLAVSFVSTDEEVKVLNAVQERLFISIPEMPKTLDKTTYMESQ